MNQDCYSTLQWTWKDKLRSRLFPFKPCILPEAPSTHKDVLISKTVCCLDVVDRIKLLFTGRLHVETRTVTENEIGACMTASQCYVLPFKILERRAM